MTIDRFASLSPVSAAHPAQLTTKPLDFHGICGITLNANTSSTMHPTNSSSVTALPSMIQVELLDERSYRIRGFEKARSIPVTCADGIALPQVRFPDRSAGGVTWGAACGI